MAEDVQPCYFVKMIYDKRFALTQSQPDKTTWATLVRDMLNTCGLGYVWMDQRVNDETQFIALFKERLTDMYRQQWWEEVELTSNNRLYKYIKTTIVHENYLNVCFKSYRMALSRMRLSSHIFGIERGRWGKSRVPVEERKCRLCDVLEDEFHCLVECPMFASQRRTCLPERLRERPSMFKFVECLKDDSGPNCVQLATWCARIMKEYRKYV